METLDTIFNSSNIKPIDMTAMSSPDDFSFEVLLDSRTLNIKVIFNVDGIYVSDDELISWQLNLKNYIIIEHSAKNLIVKNVIHQIYFLICLKT